ncbi:hypothetical protein N7541_005999 [Penicillium brevicompactum]|uniref:Protein kinase domain-containing protein n=1 Tax=Penicillium brevicompactum TaxID=5074 RepID=A0A9W9UTK4_PENBR|nr:hypothetical protein N7541_005999 [Penicillium brevicompactum]
MFLDDEYPPSAIFLEYIAGLEMISLQNYTPQRMNNFVEGIQQIHKALVRHRDPKPRNMMVVMDTPERVVWLDFDRAETYDEDQITVEQKDLLGEENEIVNGFIYCLATDHEKGKLNEAYIFYCT